MKRILNLSKRIFTLVTPFGKNKLLFIFILSTLQGVFQTLSVFAVLPFLILATNPQRFAQSGIGEKVLANFPNLDIPGMLWYAGLITIGLLITSNIINILADYLRAKYAFYIGKSLGTFLINSFAQQPYVFHLKTNSADLVKRLQSDLNGFIASVLLPYLDAASRSISLLLIVTIIFLVDPVVCVVAFSSIGVLIGISYLVFRRPMVRGNKERRIYIKNQFLNASQLFSGIKTVLIHSAQGFFINRYKAAWEKLAKHDTYDSFASSTPRYVIEAVAYSSVISLIIAFKGKGNNLEEILPSLAFFVMASYRILPSLMLIYNQVTRIQSQRFTLDLIYEDFLMITQNAPSTIIKEETPLEKFSDSILVENLSFKYPKSTKYSLKDVSFSIKKGSRIGIVGPSGSGKSTLIDLLLGLLVSDEGNISIDGRHLSHINVKAWQRQIGYVSQDIFLTDDTVKKNIAFGIEDEKIDDQKVIAVAHTAQIHDFISSDLPLGYDTVCGERGVRFSGGQRQRIALARALYHDPTVLVFDEATSALDKETEMNLIEAIELLPADLTIIMIAHRISTLRSCEEILVFEEGKFVRKSTYRALIQEAVN